MQTTKSWKKWFKIFSLFMLVAIAYLLFWPVAIDPKSWKAPKNAGYVDAYAPNNKMSKVRLIKLAGSVGPEDAGIGPDGKLYANTDGGKILRIDLATEKVDVFTTTNGRPLGIEFGPAGFLYIADAYKGLLKISPSGAIETLANKTEDGSPIDYADDLDVAKDGTVYFSDASTKFGAKTNGSSYQASLLDLMEHGLYGRILKYDPIKKSVSTIVSKLSFANGVALAKDESFLMIAETGTYSVLKHWLKGEKAGKTETLIQNLPGFPDNINVASDGTFWLGLVSPRSDALDGLSAKPFLRKVVQRLPAFMRPKAQRYGFVMRFNDKGRVLETIQGPKGAFALTTGAVSGPNGSLIITSLVEPAIAVLDK